MILLTRTIPIEEDLVDQLFNSSEKPLARALMNKFRELGFIKYNGTLEGLISLLNVVLHH